ncbi:thioesterase II family protein [Dactylosporangium sp. CA-139114]|uniref:thioesterase II family protein n=1 Tax=Dactylosporangium sp. CA-139114 TaxID=3239931 RepID=UPI003D9963B2
MTGSTHSPGYLRLATGGRLVDRRWLARPRRVADPAARVICFPHIGAGAAVYNDWPDRFDADVEVCAVRLPGRENRLDEPHVEELPALLDLLEPALRPVLDRPYVLFGHCSGSYLAFALTRRLRDTGGPLPARLVVSSIGAPGAAPAGEPRHLLGRDALFAQIAQFGGIAPAVLDDPDLMAMFEDVIRADYRLVERAVFPPGAPLDLPLDVVGGRDDAYVGFPELAAWRHETTRGFTMHLLPTGHFVLDESAGIVADLAARP